MGIFVLLVFVSIFITVSSLIFFFFFKQNTAYYLRISDWSSDVCSSDLVAGLARLKTWVSHRRAAFMPATDASNGSSIVLDPPKGILLLGVQGCGKSLAAKAVAGGFGVPLVRLDFGTLYNKYHGETEKNLRDALQSAEQLAPCVLWMDEIEKGIASSDSDGGVSRRVLGYLPTCMAERPSKVFIVPPATQRHQK